MAGLASWAKVSGFFDPAGVGHHRGFVRRNGLLCPARGGVWKDTGSGPGPGSGKRLHLFLLSARPSRRAAQDWLRRGSPSGSIAALGHLCLPALPWGQELGAVGPPAEKASS